MLKVFLKYEVSKDKTDKLRLSNLNSQTLRINLFGFKYELKASPFGFDMNIFFNLDKEKVNDEFYMHILSSVSVS